MKKPETEASSPRSAWSKSSEVHLNIGGAVIVALFSGLAHISYNSRNVWTFVFLMLTAWAVLIWSFLKAPSGTSRVALVSLWTWAIAFRIAGLFATPVFEDDWYRYLWDGRVFAEEGNPYTQPPAAYFSDGAVPEHFQRILDNVNYPDVRTIYGPVCEYLFLVSHWMAPGQLWPLKVMLIATDLLAIFFLLRLTSVRNALLYAWCPLVIHETAFNAHPEVLGVSALIAALYLSTKGRSITVATALAIGVAARIHALLLVPLLLWQRKRVWPMFLGLLALLYLPFWLQGSLADLHGLRVFLEEWEFNSMAFAAFASWLGTQAAKLICGAIFAAFYVWYLRRFVSHQPLSVIPRGDWIYGAFFLMSAVINPWYLLWIVPFVALFPSATGIAACVVVSWSYIHGLNWENAGLAPYQHPWWVRPAEISAVALAFAAELWQRLRSYRKAG